MDRSGFEIPSEQKWLHVLRDVGADGHPVRWEGLDFIEATSLELFVQAGWDELLFISDFVLRMLLRARSDSEFLFDWQGHVGVHGNSKALLFERITDVCVRWLDRLELIAEHHLRHCTEPSTAVRVPPALYRSGEPLDFLTDVTVDQRIRFDLLTALTRFAIAHSSASAVVARAEPDGPADSDEKVASWIRSVSMNLMVAGRYGAPTLVALDPGTMSSIERVSGAILSRYGAGLSEAFRAERESGVTDRRIVAVDAQLACDFCVVSTIGALTRAVRSDREEDWKEVGRWLSEGHRMLEAPRQRQVDLGRLDLSTAETWIRPNFGEGWPGCVQDAEEIARAYLTMITARGASTGARKEPGSFVDIATRTDVMRFRIPGPAARPWGERSARATMEVAFSKHPLQTWLLFPSTGPASTDRFWKDGPYGTILSVLDEMARRQDRERVASGWFRELSHFREVDGLSDEFSLVLFPELPRGGKRAAAIMTAPLIAVWLAGESA